MTHAHTRAGDGRLWTWGLGLHGQLGHGVAESVAAPAPVRALADLDVRITHVACGAWHTVCVDGARGGALHRATAGGASVRACAEGGGLYACGWNKDGQVRMHVRSQRQQSHGRARCLHSVVSASCR